MGKTKQWLIEQQGFLDELDLIQAREREILSEQEEEIYYQHFKENKNDLLKET